MLSAIENDQLSGSGWRKLCLELCDTIIPSLLMRHYIDTVDARQGGSIIPPIWSGKKELPFSLEVVWMSYILQVKVDT